MTAEPCSVLFFGDASQDPLEALASLVFAAKEKTLARKFLDNAHIALQDELFDLSKVDHLAFPSLESLMTLTRAHQNADIHHPALQAAEMVIVQLAAFILAYEQAPQELYPTSTTNLVIGSCIGEISAAAVSLASSLVELVPLAVEAVRVAFRLAIVAERTSRELEQPDMSRQSWSVAIPKDRGFINAAILEKIHTELDIPGRNRTYLSAFGSRTVTLSGPPTTLKQVIDKLGSQGIKPKSYEIPVRVPYHASHLYSAQTISEILQPALISKPYNAHQPKGPRRAYLSCSNGEFIPTLDRKAVLRQAVENILVSPLNWELLIKGCTKILSEASHSDWSIRPFGPTSSLSSLISCLEDASTGKVEADEMFWKSAFSSSATARAPLAIVGMAGRFPGAPNHERLWEVLMSGKDCHTEIPKDRFDPRTHLRQSAYGCFIDSPGMFDARFFNMSPREALQTDPGQRLALVTAYEALEMAGFVPNRTPSTQLSRIGTFYGQTVDEYKEQNMPQNVDTYFIPGSLRAFGPGRINRHFKFGGPASSVDTACSSGSVALNTACISIWDGECDMAVAGGINIINGSDNFIGLSAGGFLSPTGGCKTFDDSADGYCRADAVASVVIKRLDAARADNDNVLGVILSAATNYSADAVSITRPHGLTQEELYRRVLDQAALRPFDIDVVECHGTGTQAGDSSEMTSVTNVFAPAAPYGARESPLYVSAVKANIGHGEAASGVTSLIKSLLVLREQTLPPHIGIKGRLNRNFVDLDQRNVQIPWSATVLPKRAEGRRRILVNNFGAAGGNTAMVIEEPDTQFPPQIKEMDQRDYIINVTAKTIPSLRKNVQNFKSYLDRKADISVLDLSYTTTARRFQHPLRASFVGSTVSRIKDSFESWMSKGFEAPDKASKVIFAFTGQGAVYASLGRDLFESSSCFRSSILRLHEIAMDYHFPSFLTVVDGSCNDVSSLTTTQTQLATTASQIALCQLWASLGVRPDLVLGHSLGEYAALYASGVLTLNDTIYLVGRRAQILEAACPPGTHAMLAVSAPLQSVNHMQEVKTLEVACINGPNDTVLSGSFPDVQRACENMKACGVKCKLLELPYGFHSPQINPILKPFEKVARGIRFNRPKIPIVSPLLGSVIEDADVVGATYLGNQARKTVNFAGSIQFAQSHGFIDSSCVWLEVGPHPFCLAMIRSTLGSRPREVASLRRNENSWSSMAQAISNLFVYGLDINWHSYHQASDVARKVLVLPSYAFDEKDYWMEYQNDWLLAKTGLSPPTPPSGNLDVGPATTTVQRLLSQEFLDDGRLSMLFESDLSDPNLHAAILGHSVNGSGLCPASIYGDIALTVANYTREKYYVQVPIDGMDICDMVITSPILVPKDGPTKPEILNILVHVNLETGRIWLEFGRRDSESEITDWRAKCTVNFGDANAWMYEWSKMTYLIATRIKALENGVFQGTSHKLFRGMIYKLFSSCVDYDPKYQGMKEVLLNSEDLESTALLDLYQGQDGGSFFCSPFWIDTLVHLAGFVMNANDAVDTSSSVYLSSGWRSMRFARAIDSTLPYRIHVKMIAQSNNMVAGDVSVLQDGKIVAVVSDLRFRKVAHKLLDTIIPPPIAGSAETPATHKDTRHGQSNNVDHGQISPAVQDTAEQMVDRVFDIIAEQVGISIQELFMIDTFEEMGIDSLLTLQILDKVTDSLHLDLDGQIFQVHHTPQALRRYLVSRPKNDTGERSESTMPSTETESSSAPSSPSSSADDKISLLHSILAEQLGVEVHELLGSENLSELGLDSLMGLSILDALRDQFIVEIKPDLFAGNVSLASIENLVGLATSTPTISSSYPSKSQERHPVVSLSVVLQSPIRPAGRTLFLFPDGSGSPAIYARLHFPPELRVVGLQSPFIHTTHSFDYSLDEIVTSWIAEVRHHQRHGPYSLAGYSAGGYYAFEAMRQLQAAGDKVPHLVLIDSPCLMKYQPMPAILPEWLMKNGIIRSQNDRRIAEHFESTIRVLQTYHPVPVDRGEMPRVTIMWASAGAGSRLPNTAPLPPGLEMADVTEWLLQRGKVSGGDADGWEKLLPGSIATVRKIPGHHFNLLQPPNNNQLGRLIGDAVR